MKLSLTILILFCFVLTSCYDGIPNKKTEKEEILVCGTKNEEDPFLEVSEERSSTSIALFKAKCAACHMIDKNSTGPKMINAVQNEPYPGWVEEFVFNQDSLLRIKEPHTMEKIKWSPVQCLDHGMDKLSKDQKKEFMDYLRSLK